METNSPGSPFGHAPGPDGWDDPISLYMIKTDEDLNIIDEIDVRFAPTGEWSTESEKVHKIPEAIARRYPSQNLGLEKIIEFVPEGSTMVFHARKVGHYFDYGIMLALFEKHEKRGIFYNLFPNFISTVDILRERVNQGVFSPIMRPGADGKLRPSYRLDLWCDKFGIELDHHEVKSDAMACYKIFSRATTSQQLDKTPNRSQQEMTLR